MLIGIVTSLFGALASVTFTVYESPSLRTSESSPSGNALSSVCDHVTSTSPVSSSVIVTVVSSRLPTCASTARSPLSYTLNVSEDSVSLSSMMVTVIVLDESPVANSR